MVFPSVPVYLDPPNWNQQQQAHQQLGSSRAAGSSGGGSEDPLIPPGLAVPHSSDGTVSGSAGRSVSMAERARLAKIPQPEPALKCPRCDSPNTKFCYFNNYSLSQPRHFCKTCRRYWTRGGALRSVPVGGGCRRNKRSKSSVGSSSKSTSGATSDRQAGASSSSSVAVTSAAAGAMTSSSMPLQPHIPFLASLHPLPDYVTPNLGLSFARIPQTDAGDYQVTGAGGGLESLRVHQQMQHLPNFLGALEPPQTLPPASVAGLYSLVGEGSTMDGSSLIGHAPTMKAPHSGFITQLVKMEDSHNQGLNFPRSYLSAQQNLDNFWNTAGSSGGESSGGSGAGASGWAPDLSGFSTSATGNPL